MKSRRRIVPPVAVLLLFAATLRGPATGAATSPPSSEANFVFCSPSLQSASGESTYVIGPPSRFVQPIAGQSNLVECDVQDVDYNRGAATGKLVLEYWDPVALIPDPTTVALRSHDYGLSALAYDMVRLAFDPPVVLKSVPGVAEAPRQTAAIDYRAVSNAVYHPDSPQWLSWSPDGDPAVPPAYNFTTGTAVPLPGPHGILGHALCGGNDDTQRFMVCQSVMRCDTLLLNNVRDVVERFRLPTRTRVGWIELAAGAPGATAQPGAVAILDASLRSPDGVPPADTTAALARANLGGVEPNTWITHFDFDQTVTLEPNHDYFLWVRTNAYYSFYLRSRWIESPDFVAGARIFWTRQSPADSWLPDPRHDVAFRVIGVPVDLVAVGDAGHSRAASLELAAAPNPTRWSATLRWSGARGAVRFDVFDAHGRRLATESVAGTAGSWTWRAGGSSGGAAGLYFVRATDAAGRSAGLRVTIFR